MENHPKSKERVGIIGLGYVGLPLAMLFVSKGIEVIGIDIDRLKIDSFSKYKSYLTDITDEEIRELMESGRFTVSDQFDRVEEVSTVILCVPTPLRDHTYPDLSYVQSATNAIAPFILNEQLIVLESSTFPGTTEEVLLPILERNGKQVGKDFYLGYSPERIDPGNKFFTLDQIPKVVSGVTLKCQQRIMEAYGAVFQKVVPVSNPRTAEMTKLLENSQRFINISFMNEMAAICERMDINIWEVVDAATTKPYGFTPYYPGPGIGGHCIPVDPLYLQWKANQYQIDSKFIQLSKTTNDTMPHYIIKRIASLLPQKEIVGSSILLIGVTYKKDVNDMRESTAIQIFEQLVYGSANVQYYDPYIPSVQIGKETFTSVELTPETLQAADCAVILADHSILPYDLILANSVRIFDTRNSLPALPNVTKL